MRRSTARQRSRRPDPLLVVINTHRARGASNSGFAAAAARTLGRHHDLELRRVGWDDKRPVFRPIRHAWRMEVAHGRLGRSRRPAKSFEYLSDRLAPGRLLRDPSPPVTCRGSPARASDRSVRGRRPGARQNAGRGITGELRRGRMQIGQRSIQ